MKRARYWIITLLIFIGVWESNILIFEIPNYLFPSLLTIFQTIQENFPRLMNHLLITSSEILIAFAISTSLAIIISIASVYSKYINEIIHPLLVIIQITPKIALAPLFLIWMGYGLTSKVVIASFFCFFPITLELKKGIDSVNPNLIDIMKSIGASKKDILLKLQLPHALPYFFSGLKIGIALATIGVIVGEYVSANKGLGYQIFYSAALLDTPMVFAAIFFVIVIGLSFYGIISFAERKVVYWKH